MACEASFDGANVAGFSCAGRAKRGPRLLQSGVGQQRSDALDRDSVSMRGQRFEI